MRTRREMAAKLGELLASRGKLDREVLLRALRAQRTSGGRLGTILLELGVVSESDLLGVLADQLKVPFVEPDDLRSVPPEALKLVPPKTALKLGAVPVRSGASQLTVAMLDPLDLAALDELAFVSGRRVRPHVALEVRIQEALARHYKVDVPTRFVQLADRLSRAQFMWKDEGGAPVGESEPPARRELVSSAPAWASPSSTVAPPAAAPAVRALPGYPVAPPRIEPPRPAFPSPPPQRPALDFDAAETRLLQPTSRDEVAETLLEFLQGRVDVALVLMVRRDEAAGWRGRGLPQDVTAAVRIPLNEPSLVLALRDGAPMHRGRLTPLKGNAPLIAAVGADAADLLALPLRVRDRLVAVLIAIQRRSPLEAGLSEDLQRLAVKAAGALELIVLRQKLGKACRTTRKSLTGLHRSTSLRARFSER